MSRALKESLKGLKTWVFASPSRVMKLARGEGAPGTRAAPAQVGNNDKKIGVRLDNADTIVKDGKTFKRYKFQVNKGAENPTLKTLADKNSHEVWSHADIPVGEGDPEDVVNHLFEDLEKNLKK
ncbi:hypothetical protein TI39_contig679g00001 [Zymoseptoria brevis]|uniref:Uncharacterized protein n=1 Tax=Zymoseptoria brevis TaxID=1047168 RepID=A0A0F4GFS5_9PEZI|nr:hypothetical protein TI39_contig679g00001 [Zymoseptoria brevis]